MHQVDRALLKKRANSLRSQMRALGQMIKGSILIRTIPCGKANCKCTKGVLHRAICITYKEKGKTKTVYIAKEHEAEALLMCANYKKLKELLQKLTLTNIDIVRTTRRYNVKRKERG